MDEKKRKRLLTALLALGGVMLFYDLGGRYMWQDEAQTPLLAKTVLMHGVPKATDGLNNFSQMRGAEYGEDLIWRWHQWLPFYLLAPFLKILGPSTFAARLPFVLISLASLYVFYLLARRYFGDKRALFALFCLALYVPFMLLARQSRYYAPEMFFCILGLYSWAMMPANEKKYGIMLFFSTLGLFHSLHLYYFILCAALLTHSFLFRRDKLQPLFIIIAASAALNLPFFFTIYNVGLEAASPVLLSGSRLAIALKNYGAYTFIFLMPAILLLIPIFITSAAVLKKKRIFTDNPLYFEGLALLVIFCLSAITAMSFLAHTPFYRNIAATVPIFALLCALILYPIARINPLAGIAAMLLFLNLLPSPLYKFLGELKNGYSGPIRCITDYLNANAPPGSKIAISYGDMPLKFYTNFRIIGGLAEGPVSEVREADYIILRKHDIDERCKEIKQYVFDNLDRNMYEMVDLGCPDEPDENSEAPHNRRFSPDKTEDTVKVFIRK